jgi:hypothetical protein
MSFFLLASKANKYKASMKKKLEDDFKEGKIYCFMLYINMELYLTAGSQVYIWSN